MREAYRIQKSTFYKSLEGNPTELNVAFLYTATVQHPYETIYTSVNKLLNILTKESTAKPKIK